MKKIVSSTIMVVTAALMFSCGNTNPKVKLRNTVDSLSYAYGVKYTNGLRGYLEQQAHIDSIYMSEFYKGVMDGFKAGNDKKRNAYYWGLQIGQRANEILMERDAELTSKDSVPFLSRDKFIAGFINGAREQGVQLDSRQIDSLITFIGQKIASDNREKVLNEKKKASVDYMTKKAKTAGINKLPGGVLYKVIKQGSGKIPTLGAVVKVKYEGKLPDGTVFDTTDKRGGQPAEFRTDGVIPGWTQVLTNMPVGSVWQVFIPQEQAYGERGYYNIPPYSALEFTMELVDVVEP